MAWQEALIKPIFRAGRRLHDLTWEARWRWQPKHRYNIVRTGLAPAYYDPDTRMLHAAFATLCEYVEAMGGDSALAGFSKELREEPDPNGPKDLQEQQAASQDEAVALYRWWKVEKPADQARCDELLMALYGDRPLFTKPVEGANLVEYTPPEFDAAEEAMRIEFRALENKIRDDETTMLHRLVDIRPSLWI